MAALITAACDLVLPYLEALVCARLLSAPTHQPISTHRACREEARQPSTGERSRCTPALALRERWRSAHETQYGGC